METTSQPPEIVAAGQQQLLREAVKVLLAPPPMYQVVLLNDDYTPMDFVVLVLQKIFYKNLDEAESIMLQVHHQGRGVCGVYTRDIAATRVDAVMRLAQSSQHPLQCHMEPVPLP